jgi:hypothetical protein
MTLGQIAYFAVFAATIFGILVVRRLARPAPIAWWKSALIVAGCIGLALIAFRISDPPRYFEDFRIAYYPAGRAALKNPDMLRALMGMGVSGFVNLPAVAYLFAPLAMLPMPAAMALFTAIGVAAIAAAWFLLARLAALDLAGRWLLALLFVANGPLQYSLKEGNLSHFILLALAGGLALLRAGRPAAAGALLGAAAIIKPPLLLFALFFGLRRDARGFSGFAAICIAAFAASVVLFGLSDNLRWFEICVLQFSHRWLAAFNVQSIPAFLFRLQAAPALLRDWNSYAPPDGASPMAQILVAGLFAVAGLAARNGALRPAAGNAEGTQLTLQYLLVLCLAVVASPLSWSHYYCWLLLPTAFFLGQRSHGPSARIGGWAAILLVTPLVRPLALSGAWAITTYKDFAVSHLLFGGLLWFALVAWQLGNPVPSASRPGFGAVLPRPAGGD